jgi:hypothetical protein
MEIVGVGVLPDGPRAVQVDVRLGRLSSAGPASYFLDSVTRRLVAKQTESNGAYLYETYRSGYLQAIDEAAFAGFQLTSSPRPSESLVLGGTAVPWSQAKNPFEPKLDVLKYTLPDVTPAQMQVSLRIGFDAATAFPLSIRTPSVGSAVRTANVRGAGAPVLASTGSAPATGNAAVGSAWDGPLPPETVPSRFAFSLRTAYGVLEANDPGFRSFKAGHSAFRLCNGLYRESHPIVPPDVQSWEFQFCSDDGGVYSATVENSNKPVMQYAVRQAGAGPAEPVIPRALLPLRLVPIDSLWARETHEHGWKMDSLHDVAFVFESGEYRRELTFLRPDEVAARSSIIVKFIPNKANGEQQFWYNADDGSLHGILGPKPAAMADHGTLTDWKLTPTNCGTCLPEPSSPLIDQIHVQAASA